VGRRRAVRGGRSRAWVARRIGGGVRECSTLRLLVAPSAHAGSGWGSSTNGTGDGVCARRSMANSGTRFVSMFVGVSQPMDFLQRVVMAPPLRMTFVYPRSS